MVGGNKNIIPSSITSVPPGFLLSAWLKAESLEVFKSSPRRMWPYSPKPLPQWSEEAFLWKQRQSPANKVKVHGIERQPGSVSQKGHSSRRRLGLAPLSGGDIFQIRAQSENISGSRNQISGEGEGRGTSMGEDKMETERTTKMFGKTGRNNPSRIPTLVCLALPPGAPQLSPCSTHTASNLDIVLSPKTCGLLVLRSRILAHKTTHSGNSANC